MLVPAQIAAAVIALAALALWPPASGAMLLVPLGSDAGTVATIALAGGAALLDTGPFPGSLVVVGDRARIARQITGWSIVITAAPSAGCSADSLVRRSA